MLCKSRLEFNGKFIDLKARYSGVEYFVHGYKSWKKHNLVLIGDDEWRFDKRHSQAAYQQLYKDTQSLAAIGCDKVLLFERLSMSPAPPSPQRPPRSSSLGVCRVCRLVGRSGGCLFHPAAVCVYKGCASVAPDAAAAARIECAARPGWSTTKTTRNYWNVNI